MPMTVEATAPAEIRVSLEGDGKSISCPRGTTVGDALRLLDGKRARKALAARVDGAVLDVTRELVEDAVLEPLLPDSPAGLDVLRHSTAHLLAQAVQELFPGTQVTIGPVIDDGFYYDFVRAEPFTPADLEAIEKRMREIVARNLPVSRRVLSKADAVRLFAGKGESYKVEIIEGIPESTVSVYAQGDWEDLCRGPHVPSTGRLGSFKLTSVAGAYWRGDERNAMLQRIYGTAWATDADLKRHLELVEEAKRRDHRKLGRELDLFSFDPIAPGSPFFHPKGAYLYNRLIELVRGLYVRFGYDEVISPQIYDVDLWKRSGHWEHYRENLFFVEIDERSFGVKPMNCPGHTYIYASTKRSYRDLPIRMADFSRLHRYEKSGVLHGLTRVRAFTQDDAHVFCTHDQVREEITAVLAMAKIVHRAFAFEDMRVFLSTRPEQRLGTDAMWDRAERDLAAALEANGLPFEVAAGDGAFYGPKIDFLFRDALRRDWQLTTVQLDYALPERFDLGYVTTEGKIERPVMIHRALLGSIERFLGILIEHTGGAFPTWLAPVQAKVLTVTERQEEYGAKVSAAIRAAGHRVELDTRNEKLGYKIRQAQLEKVPYMLVLGDREAADGLVAPRARAGGQLEPMSIERFLEILAAEARLPLPGDEPGGVP
jgi:threonyl-tRNA synthetase